jgi:hypothetical protein
MKQCSKCLELKPLSEYSIRKDTGHVRGMCKECVASSKKQSYLKNKQTYVDRAMKHRTKHRNKLKQLLRDLKNVPCKDCGVKYPYYVMDFDHVSDKSFDINRITANCWNEEKVKKELSKCEVVCSNCHRERTHKRKQYYAL